jgi:hypothetical protein
LAVALVGCGLGAGPSSSGTATLTVTRDYGAETLADATDDDPAESDTVIRLLDREADISTRYGGGFVQSIDGLAGAERSGRRYDWFFYVNGVESPVGAADVRVHGGDRIWWDYRDWTDAMSVPAVVGSWPEPFAQASSDPADRVSVRVECAAPRPACRTVADRLRAAGAQPGVEPLGSRGASSGGRSLSVLVGPWRALRRQPAAFLRGPATSGVFATFKPAAHGRFELVLSDPQGEPRCGYGAGAGLVAAVEASEGRSTWLVTGTDAAGVRRAADALDAQDLRDRYAIAAPSHAAPLGVPVGAAGGASDPCQGGAG